MAGAGDAFDFRAQGVGSEGAGGEDGEGGVGLGKGGYFLANHANQRLGGDGLTNEPGKFHAIDGQCVTCGDSGFVGDTQQGGTGAPHLLLQQPGRGVGGFAFEGVGTDQFTKIGGLVGRGEARLAIDGGPHLEEVDLAAEARRGEGCFRAGKASANDANLHWAAFSFTGAGWGSRCPILSAERCGKDGAPRLRGGA